MIEKKGISLIVLIVTIIVMIIIAGVVIISLTDTNIIDQASNSTTKWNVSSIQEQLNIKNALLTSGLQGEYLTKVVNGTLKEIGIEDDEWNEKLLIENGKIVYRSENVTNKEAESLENMGIEAGNHMYIVSAQTKSTNKYENDSNAITIDELSNNTDKIIYLLEDVTVSTWTTISEFTGTLNGSNHKINGIDNTFVTINTGTIKNITLAGECEFGMDSIFVKENKGELYNCHNEVNILDGVYFGGLAYVNKGIIVNCSNKGNINVSSHVGGLVYVNDGGTLLNSFNSGAINIYEDSGIEDNAGLVAQNIGIIKNCYNKGNIVAIENTAGLVNTYPKDIENCYNMGEISGNNIILTAGGSNVFSINIEGAVLGNGKYIEELEDDGEEGVTAADKAKLLNKLNENNTTKIWVEDVNNINDGFPILYWQAK